MSCTICCSDVTVCTPAVITRLPILLVRFQLSLAAVPRASEHIGTWQTMCRSSNSTVTLESFQVLLGLLQEILLQCPGLGSTVSPLHTYAASCASVLTVRLHMVTSQCLTCSAYLTNTMQHATETFTNSKCVICQLPLYVHSVEHAAHHKNYH